MISNPELQKWERSGQHISIADQKYFYKDQGDGPVLLMIHGFPMSSWDWKDVFADLSKTYRVLAPDMLGYGFSEKPVNGDYSTSAHAQMHESLLRALAVNDIHILTYSFGCSVTQQMLANTLSGQSGLNIKSVTFMNGGLFPASNHPNSVQLALLGPDGPSLVKTLSRKFLDTALPPIFGPDTQPSNQLITDYWELLEINNGRLRLPQLIGYLNDRTNLADSWRKALINHPAKKQLIAGMVDEISGPKMADEYRETVPGAKITRLERIGHYPQIEAPDIVIKLVRSFAT